MDSVRWIVKETADAKDDDILCGNLSLQEACAYAAALNTGAISADRFYWCGVEHHFRQAWCIIDLQAS